MSMSLRTAMQTKCCCASHPPLYKCKCMDLRSMFNCGEVPQPLLLTMRVNMTAGICEHFTGDIQHYACYANCDCDHSPPYPPCPDPASVEYPTCRRPTHSKTWMEMWLLSGSTCGGSACLSGCYPDPQCPPNCTPDPENMECYIHEAPCGHEVCHSGGGYSGGDYNFVNNSHLISVIDGNHHLRFYDPDPNDIWEAKGRYIPDDDFYGEILVDGSESDDLSYGASPKVGYTPGLGRSGHIWYDGSSDIGTINIWFIPPSGWSCGDPVEGYIRGLYVDILGGGDEGRHELLFSDYPTLRELEAKLNAINSGIHLFRTALGGTPLENKVIFDHTLPWNNCLCGDNHYCSENPPNFPPDCGVCSRNSARNIPGQCDWNYNLGLRHMYAIPVSEDCWNFSHPEGALVLQTSTSTGIFSGGTYPVPLENNKTHTLGIGMECIEFDEYNSLQGRGWEFKMAMNIFPDWGSPIGVPGSVCLYSTEPAAWVGVLSQRLVKQRYRIATSYQGDCGTSLFDWPIDNWGGNLAPTIFAPAGGDCEPNEGEGFITPMPGSSGHSVGDLCTLAKCPGCVSHECWPNCDYTTECRPKGHFWAQATGINVDEWLDYPPLS